MEPQESVQRKVLVGAVSSLLLDIGFDTADKDSLGTLTEMIQCFICEVGTFSKNYCELSGRCEPLLADIILAFTEMGYNYSNIDYYIKSAKPHTLPAIQTQVQHKQVNMLNAGTKQNHPSYVPPHFPRFPDPHAYIRTPTHKQPIIDYESVRERAALQKKDVEKALTKFLAKTSTQSHSLFDTDDINSFPLVSTKPPYPPYLSALLPQDQIFDPEDLEYDPKSEITEKVKEEKPSKKAKMEPVAEEPEPLNDSVKSEDNSQQNIDNPYLAATKLPKQEEIDVT